MSVTIDRECVEHAQAPRTRFHRAVSLQSRAAMLGAQVGIRSLVAGMDGRARLSLANTGSPVWCRSARPEPIPRDNVEARPGRAGCGAAWATSVRHRRSPVSISSAVADALDGYRWLHETGYCAGDIVVAERFRRWLPRIHDRAFGVRGGLAETCRGGGDVRPLPRPSACPDHRERRGRTVGLSGRRRPA